MDKFVTSGALKQTIDLTKENLHEHDTRLQNIENATPTELQCENAITKIPDNVQNVMQLTSVQGKTVQNLYNPISENLGTNVPSNCTFNADSSITLTSNGDYVQAIYKNATMFKTSTVYTLIFDISSNTLNGTINLCLAKEAVFRDNISISGNVTGVLKYKLTSYSSLPINDVTIYQQLYSTCTTGSITYKMMILEGDWTAKEIPAYFEGIQSVQNPLDVQVTGKNLFNVNKFTNEYSSDIKIIGNTIKITSKELGNRPYRYKVEGLVEGRQYTISAKVSSTSSNANARKIRVTENISVDTSSYGFVETDSSLTFTMKKDLYLVGYIQYAVDAVICTTTISDLIIEESAIATEYKPYKRPINYTVPFDGELRSLPNGVCDEIKDGKLIRRVGKIVINGNETWYEGVGDTSTFPSLSDRVNTRYYTTNDLQGKIPTNNSTFYEFLICDKFSNISVWKNDVVGTFCTNGILRISIPKTTIANDNDITSLKAWLKENPITYYIELLEPEIIELETIYNNPVIKAYANGNVIQNNVPIHPTLTFAYQTGLQGKINDLQVEVEQHESEIRNMLANETGLQTVTERVNDLVMQDGNVKLEEMQGNTIQNHMWYEQSKLHNYSEGHCTIDTEGYATIIADGANFKNMFLKAIPTIKPSTKYTLVLDIVTNTLSESNSGMTVCNNETTNNPQFRNEVIVINKATGTGIKKYLITSSATASTDELSLRSYMHNTVTGTLKFRIMLLEGDWTGKEIPAYFTGIKSVNEEQTGLQVRSVGKNIVNHPEAHEKTVTTFNHDIFSHNAGAGVGIPVSLLWKLPYVIKGKTYTISYKYETSAGTDPRMVIRYVTRNGDINTNIEIQDVRSGMSFEAQETGLITLKWNAQSTGKIRDIQLEEGNVVTEYEPYKESAITIPYAEPLRRLPNGVCDTIEDGKVIRRVGKTVLNGSEQWNVYAGTQNNDTTTYAQIDFTGSKGEAEKVNGTCDTLKARTANDVYRATTTDYNIFSISSTYDKVRVRLLTSNLTAQTNEGIQSYFASNPATIYYELATPIVEELPEITLAGYKHLIFDNDIVPTSATVSFANSNYARLVATEKTNASQSKTIADLCAVTDYAILQNGQQEDAIAKNKTDIAKNTSDIANISNVIDSTINTLINDAFKDTDMQTYWDSI